VASGPTDAAPDAARGRLWIVLGADGALGSAIRERLVAEGQVVLSTTRRRDREAADGLYVDLSDGPIDLSPGVEPIAALLCAGIASFEACRREPVLTHRVNVENTAESARRLAARGARVVLPSSTSVFDGTIARARPGDPVTPTTEYGRQKAEAEQRVLDAGGTVLRLGKVLPPGFALFRRWRDELAAGRAIEPFRDLVMAPLGPALAVDALLALARISSGGVFHLSSRDEVSYADAAFHVAARTGAPPDLVRPTTSAAAGIQVDYLPRHAALDSSQLTELTGLEAPNVWDVVDGAIDA
jgi:dTDP-4-dehydrorhamnose reductase